MKLPTFRRDALAAARAKLKEVEAVLAELANDRAEALASDDDDGAVAAVQAIDQRMNQARSIAAVLEARVAALEQAARKQRAEEAARAHAAAIAKVEARVAEVVADAEAVEQAIRTLGDAWYKLLDWRSTLLKDWDDDLERPPAGALHDVGPLVREVGYLLYAAGRPTAQRRCSLRIVAPTAVEGMGARGLKRYVSETCAGVVAQLKAARAQPTDDESEEAA
jgi:hypothetical protein